MDECSWCCFFLFLLIGRIGIKENASGVPECYDADNDIVMIFGRWGRRSVLIWGCTILGFLNGDLGICDFGDLSADPGGLLIWWICDLGIADLDG